MNLLTLLKILGIVIVVMTSIILPLSMLESSIADLTAEFIEWSGESKFLNSILVIAALTGDVFLPIPNGITNTFAGAILGFYLSIPVIWTGLTLGSVIGFIIGKYAAKSLAKKILSKEDFGRSSKKIWCKYLVACKACSSFSRNFNCSCWFSRYEMEYFSNCNDC